MPLLVSVVRRFDRSAKRFRYSTENNAWILISSSVTKDTISKSRVSNWCLCYNFKCFIIESMVNDNLYICTYMKSSITQIITTVSNTAIFTAIVNDFWQCFWHVSTQRHSISIVKKTLWAFARTTYSKMRYFTLLFYHTYLYHIYLSIFRNYSLEILLKVWRRHSQWRNFFAYKVLHILHTGNILGRLVRYVNRIS